MIYDPVANFENHPLLMILTTKKAAHIAKFAEFVWFVWLCSNVHTVPFRLLFSNLTGMQAGTNLKQLVFNETVLTGYK